MPVKGIFAGKTNLKAQPFCPVITNARGYQSLNRIGKPSLQLPYPVSLVRIPWLAHGDIHRRKNREQRMS